LIFCTGKHDALRFRDGIREVIGLECLIVGGFAVGIITADAASYDGYECGVALLAGDGISVDAFAETGLQGGEARVGEALGRKLSSAGANADSDVLLFYDAVHHFEGQAKLNMATPLLRGMFQNLSAEPRLAGMGMLGDMQLLPTWQFCGDQILQQSAIALLLHGNLEMDITVMHGCRPAGRYHEITKAEGPVVLEIDGKPALRVIQEMLGADSGLTHEDYAFFVTLGVNKGDRFAEFKEDNYANRMCIGVDLAREGLIMFENDLTPGTLVQLMRRSMDFAYLKPRTDGLFAKIAAAGRTPVLAFYIDCAGRAAAYCGLDAEEADEVRKAVPVEVPLLGVYSGVEIAPIGGKAQALDWTGVLCVFSS
jgi:small ligand-binding sensory domain FIST